MPATATSNDPLRRKRELRLRIGRSRRRIDRRLRAARDRVRQLASWRTFVVRYPGWAIGAALGVGLFASAGLGHRRASRWLGRSLVRHAMRGLRRQFWNELKHLWEPTDERSR